MSRRQPYHPGPGSLRPVALASVVVIAVGGLLAGCSSSHKAGSGAGTSSSTSTSSATGGAAGSLGAITSKLQGAANTPFEATYAISGSTGTTSLELAVSPPGKFVFVTTSANGSKDELISAGQLSDSCVQAGGSWTCTALPQSQFASVERALQIYKSSYWTRILAGLQSAAKAGGIKVTASTKSLAGQTVQCVTYSGAAAGSGGEICVTRDGVLAYVRSAANGSSFALSTYSTSPPPSLFGLPPGATIAKAP